MIDDATHQDINTIASDKAATYQSINAVAIGSSGSFGNIQDRIQPKCYINIPDGAKIKTIYNNKG